MDSRYVFYVMVLIIAGYIFSIILQLAYRFLNMARASC